MSCFVLLHACVCVREGGGFVARLVEKHLMMYFSLTLSGSEHRVSCTYTFPGRVSSSKELNSLSLLLQREYRIFCLLSSFFQAASASFRFLLSFLLQDFYSSCSQCVVPSALKVL